MKRFILFCLFNFSVVISLFSQSNFKNGYVITNEYDTIYGQIDFRTDNLNAQTCKFRKEENAEVTQYNPGEIAGYRFTNEGKYYVSHTITLDSIKNTVFLEFLVQGYLNLYYYPKDNGYYFFENSNGEMIPITKKTDEITYDNRTIVDKKYQGVVFYALRDDLPLVERTSKLQFDRKSMIEITNEYHNDMCQTGEKCIVFENDFKKKFTTFDFTAFSGCELNYVKFDYWNLPRMRSLSPILGVGLNVSDPRVAKSLHLSLDATVSKIESKCDYYEDFIHFLYNFEEMKYCFTGGLEYIYHKGKIRPTVNAGVNLCYYTNMSSNLKANATYFEDVMLPKTFKGGAKVGLGLDYQIKDNHFVMLRFIVSKDGYSFEKYNTFQLRIGYKI